MTSLASVNNRLQKVIPAVVFRVVWSAHLLVYEPYETLHLIQNGLNL
jgi:hypothetical protein